MSQSESTLPFSAEASLSSGMRYLILVCAFLGWFFAGFHLSITSLVMRPAAIDLLDRTGELDKARFKQLNQQTADLSPEEKNRKNHWENLVVRWFAWNQCAFLFGAASGGFVFGRLGDHWGRSRAMALSIATYSLMSAAASTAQAPWQLLVLWYLACTGVGGMWPNGVALVSEAWSSLSRPLAAGIIGTSANIGLFLFATLAKTVAITPDSWRWTMLVAACPVVLGIFVLLFVPESPHWLAARRDQTQLKVAPSATGEVFYPPLRTVTIIGIMLATIPMIGAWGSANWMVPWADAVGSASSNPQANLSANVQQARAMTGLVGSLLGGWIGSVLGRRFTYFLVSMSALAISQYTFWFVVPTDQSFLYWVAALGFFSGIYFGWLPLFLPELFPTRIRSTGAGVSFNFGRILTAVTIFTTGALKEYFSGDYAQMGRATSLIFAIGMIVICLAPETSKKQLLE